MSKEDPSALTPEAIAFWEALAAQAQQEQAAPELSLGGGSGPAGGYGNPQYNPLTGGTDVVGGGSGGTAEKYKQNVILGGGGRHYTPEGLTSGQIMLGDTAGFRPTPGADGVTVWVPTEGYQATPWGGPAPIGNPNYDPSGGGGSAPPPTGGGQPPPPTGGGGGGGGGMPSIPGDGNNPQPPEETEWELGRRSPPRDTSWQWDHFKPKQQGSGEWGGYDEDYQAFERYQPGMDSPWGMPNIEGGNRDFYQQQFVNMLRDEQGYQNRERNAQSRRIFAQNNPQEIDAQMGDWSWANSGKGLGQVQPGTGNPAPTGYEFNEEFAGMSLPEIWGQVQNKTAFNRSDSSKSAQDVLNNYFNDPNRTGQLGETDFSAFDNPGAAFASINPTSWEGMNRPGVLQEGLRTVFNQVYNPIGQGPAAPVGYAAPLATY